MATIVSTIGVTALLAAYALQAAGRLEQSTAYYALNLLGSTLAAVGSWLIGFAPFVVLEVAWAATAAGGLIAVSKQRRLRRSPADGGVAGRSA